MHIDDLYEYKSIHAFLTNNFKKPNLFLNFKDFARVPTQFIDYKFLNGIVKENGATYLIIEAPNLNFILILFDFQIKPEPNQYSNIISDLNKIYRNGNGQ